MNRPFNDPDRHAYWVYQIDEHSGMIAEQAGGFAMWLYGALVTTIVLAAWTATAEAQTAPTKIGLPERLAPQATQERAGKVELRLSSGLTGSVSLPSPGGVPLAYGALIDPAHARLLNADGAEQPAQFTVLSRWPDGSIRWLLVETMASPNQALTLEYGPTVAAKAAPAQPLKVEQTADAVTFTTGDFRWRVSHKGGLKLFDEVAIGSRVLTGAGVSGPSVGAAFAAEPTEFRIEEAGPLRATLLARGVHRDAAGRKTFDYTLRATAFAGQKAVQLQYTFIQSDEPIYVETRDVAVTLPLAGASSAAFGGADSKRLALAEHPATLLQQRRQFDPNGFKYPFALTQNGQIVAAGERAPGWLDVSGPGGGAAVIVRDFWQNCPKSLTADKTGLRIGLIPKDTPVSLHTGMAKTHEMLFVFHDGPFNSQQIQPQLAAFQDVPLLMATPDHYAATKAFGDIVPVRPDKHVAFEQRAIQQAIRDHVLQRELKGLYGVLDFGDSLYGESADQLWNNMETAFDHGLFTLGIRHGEKRYMDLARVAARHFADIDVRHCNPASFDFGVLVGPKIEPAEAERISRGLSVKSFEKVRKKGSSELTLPLDGSGQTYRFGGVWPGLLPDPTEHDQTGHVYGHSFNHTGHHRYDKPDQPGIGGSGIGGHTWVLGLLDLYRFYGDRRSLEVAELVGQATLRKLPKNGYRREAGWPAINLIALFNATGKIEYLRGAQELLQYLAQCEAEGRPGVKEHYTYTILQALRDYHMVTGDAGAKEMFLRRLDAATEADLAGANDAGIFDRIRTFDNERSWTSMADLAYGWRLTGDRKKYLDPIVPNLQIISMLMPDKSALWSAPWAMAALEEAGINADPNTSDGRPLKYSFLDLRFPRTKTAHLHDPQDKPIELLVLQHSGYRLARNNVKQKEVGSITITAPDGKTVLTQPLDHFGLHAYRLKLPSDGQRGTYTISIEDPQSTFGFATDAEGLVVPVGDSDKGLYLTWPHAYFRVPTSGVVKVKVTAFAVPAGGYRLYRPDGSLFAERIWPERQDKSEAAPQVAIPTTDPGRGGVWRLEMCHPKNYVHLESPQPYIATDPALLFGPNGK